MKSRLLTLLNNFKTLVLKLLKREVVQLLPQIVTKEVDAGRVDIFVAMKDGTSLQGFLKGDVSDVTNLKDVRALKRVFVDMLDLSGFAKIQSPEGNEKVFPVADVKNITLFSYPDLKIVTFEVEGE